MPWPFRRNRGRHMAIKPRTCTCGSGMEQHIVIEKETGQVRSVYFVCPLCDRPQREATS